MEDLGEEIFREGDIVYRILTPVHRDPATVLLARAFCSEPLQLGLNELKPDRAIRFHDQVEFVDGLMDDCASNGLTIVAIDTKLCRIAGVRLVRDCYQGAYFDQEDIDEALRTCPILTFLGHLHQVAHEKLPQDISSPTKAGLVAEYLMLGVHPDYRGQGIARHLMRLSIEQLKRRNYKFVLLLTTNAFTAKLAANNGMTKYAEVDARSWEYKGEAVFAKVKEPHGICSTWAKSLD